MSKPSSESTSSDALRWAEAEREQERHFKALPLAQKWRAVAEAGELLQLIHQRALARIASQPTR